MENSDNIFARPPKGHKTDAEWEVERAAHQITFEKDREEYKSELDRKINLKKKEPLVKLALKVFEERASENLRTRNRNLIGDRLYADKAEKVGKQILTKNKSMLKTSSELRSLAFQLRHLARLLELRDEIVPKENNSSASAADEQAPGQKKGLFGGLGRTLEPVKCDEASRLEEVADALESLSRRYYNNQPINEHHDFQKDGDVDSTPATLFSWTRIAIYIKPSERSGTLPLPAKNQE